MAATTALLASAAGVLGRPAIAAPFTYEMVTVGDAGNTADTTGYGAVGYAYRIGKYEFTNAQYTQFLNAVDPDGTNSAALYNSLYGYGPWTNAQGYVPWGGIAFNGGNVAGNKYAVLPQMGDKPVNYVSWYNAARVANWLHNGALTYANSALGTAGIDNGAYALAGAISGAVPARNSDARFWIPSDDEWYKAAYYKGGGANTGYWSVASQSNALTPVFATPTGVGTRYGMTPVTAPGFANYNYTAQWNLQPNNFDACCLLTVGSTGGASAYGTYEQTGNVGEWTSVSFSAATALSFWGGSFRDGDTTRSYNSRISIDAQTGPGINVFGYGFRLAGQASSPVPEIDPAGVGSVLALVGGALGLLERRRSKPAA